jgi:hypothetical protein
VNVVLAFWATTIIFGGTSHVAIHASWTQPALAIVPCSQAICWSTISARQADLALRLQSILMFASLAKLASAILSSCTYLTGLACSAISNWLFA